MAEVQDQTTSVIAKEIVIAVIEKVGLPQADPRPDQLGLRVGILYKVVLKHVKEAIIDKKYD